MAAMLWSGGKDSMLALHRALDQGLPVTTLFNLYDGASGSVRFHGVARELVGAQARALGLELLQLPLGDDDYDAVFGDGLAQLRQRGATSLVLGNIHLADVRGWYEARTRAHGLGHVEPLWGWEPRRVVEEVVRLGYRARVSGVDATRALPQWLGRELDTALLAEFQAAGIDAAGESGEYHTFVHDGPLFAHPVPFREDRTPDYRLSAASSR
jgi:diphthine-ammonia ligase